ncbi:prolactin receptor-like [Antennarius striatus]|uniref:prolactin receptor-like n=1 Tax=Antennarius striatus TaxID=241820 RepID=UPI0035B23EC0
MYLWLLLICLLPVAGGTRTVSQDLLSEDRPGPGGAGDTMIPHISFCRSRNMEDFTCWWHPVDNLTDGETVNYVLSYSKDKEPSQGCPDYVSAGPNSCHFDSSHTSIWKIYCMNVTAVTAHRNYTSREHCLDVAEIVQTDAPVNLTYVLREAEGEELGQNARLSWMYPVPSDLQYGWITLVYELQYRRMGDPGSWKVKHPLREPHLELLGLPYGDYLVRVRCRSHNYGIWSEWSSTLLMSLPSKPPTGKLLVGILVSGVAVIALLVIVCGVVPQSKRLKHYCLPPIPKPRIIGIDPLLLKKGNLDEINHHFSNFHSYSPPIYIEEVWDQVSSNSLYLTPLKDFGILADPPDGEKEALIMPCDTTPVAALHQLTTPKPMSYLESLAPYCSMPSQWPRTEIVMLSGTDYNVIEQTAGPVAAPPPDLPAPTTDPSKPGFYTCVQLMNESGEVHLVSFAEGEYYQDVPPLLRASVNMVERDAEKKLAEYQARMFQSKDGAEGENSETVAPLLPVTVDNQG